MVIIIESAPFSPWTTVHRNNVAKTISIYLSVLTGMGAQMGGQGLFPGKDSVAEFAFDRRGRRRTLDHEIRQRLGTGPSTFMLTSAAVCHG